MEVNVQGLDFHEKFLGPTGSKFSDLVTSKSVIFSEEHKKLVASDLLGSPMITCFKTAKYEYPNPDTFWETSSSSWSKNLNRHKII